MVEKNSILIRYYRDGESIRSICKSVGVSRNTVKKYIRERKDLSETETSSKLSEGLSSYPVYKAGKRSKRKLTSKIKEVIQGCLDSNQEKRLKGMHKQCMKKTDIHDYLLSQGHQIGYTSVCNYTRLLAQQSREAFIKQAPLPGIGCEFDWGQVKLYINGKLQVFQMAVFTSCYSNYRWAKLFDRQDTLAFMQSQVDFISVTKGVYKEYIYDNMRVAVAKFVGHNEKEPTRALLELSNYYKFSYRFCNSGKGNEKGHVERSVEYVRRKAFCKADHFSSLAAVNTYLFNKCTDLNQYSV